MTTQTMRALVLNDYANGQFSDARVPRPVPGAGEVLVQIFASGVNPIDYKIRRGAAPYAEPELPAILGTDLAGVVVDVGPDVTGFKVGDEVYGLTGGVRGMPGTLAEFAAVDARLLAPKPKNLSMREAAALPLVFLTAWEGLVDRARVHAGQRVLIQGGAGGVGHVAVQIARAFGAAVYATASSGKHDIVRSYGATPIDYRTTKVADYVTQYADGVGFDVVYDTVGGQTLDDSLVAAKPYGHVLSCYAFSEHNLAPGSLRCVTLSGIFVLLPMLSGEGRAHHGEILREATRLAEEGKLKPLVDQKRYTLADAHAAHDAQEAGKALGKIVIDIAS
ncbi:zinc-dependent alcohol dehydrogenase family protein [Pseudoduganella umbonata]|uniref:NADPH:quinone reductase-like Zn-dependent oxidoreductase n=1 Tax=Pseudoduganella umbonata TaxID=864828 RepID=A0A4P8HIC3_9BURK|nr:zinc-dependent alcohol dehydrogenase family protein [Pseudoduganella umbonata]MBB3225191.1 NADPH:quinone reductase-like Zn-dependent oxidoreductase [Pseudoduganella umbonata]QCP09283.1 zinc-dependent alcohol dehydrogenase family protein [Pseudoduganella umbonata]